MLGNVKVDSERFIAETIAEFALCGYKITKEDEPLVTVLYHLNYLPEHLMPNTFQYRHMFRDMIYGKDKILREETAVTYYKLLSETLAYAEVAAAQVRDASTSNSRSLALQYGFDGHHFDKLRGMIHTEILLRCSTIEPLSKSALSIIEVKKRQDEEEGPEFCW